MVVCKYFLQGTCKFGDYCKFEHQINDNFNGYQNQTGTSILHQANYASAQSPKLPNSAEPSSSNVDTSTLIKAVANDMTMLEKGGQWMLSCYAPFKEKPAFPGFEDQSFEELRLGYYEAAKNGTIDQYKQQIQTMIQQIMSRVKTLQNPSPDIVEMLKKIYNTPPSSQSGVFSGNIFSSPNTSSLNQQPTNFGIFAQGNQKLFANVQPQQQAPQNTFGSMGTNIFGGNNQNTGFGGQIPTNSPFAAPQGSPTLPSTSNSIFGQSNTNFAQQSSIFGGQQNPGSIFGGGNNANATPITGSIFGSNNSALTPQSSSQNASQNVFGNQNTQQMFGQPTSHNTNLFGTPATQDPLQVTPGIFGGPQPGQMSHQPASNIFASPVSQSPAPNTSVFGQHTPVAFSTPVNSDSAFGHGNLGAQVHSANIFGGAPANNMATHVSAVHDEKLYSKLEDLSPEEIKWFESDDLDIMNIPEKPPTFQMCFKV
ncbi:unnamed protein product [Phaedon cochleariae]|uniref:Nucleoporin NUP42 n=1 Tax=Phaedon cochleariae TaxID=80249 RepID=A0A9P0GUH8_PHACE|nr:unnamed protein product [Phaedon cochleariae]